MPPRKPSPIGSHVFVGKSPGALAYAEAVGAEALQIFASNPRGWATPKPAPAADAAFAQSCADRGLPLFIHAPYLVNLASPSDTTRERSAASIAHSLSRGAGLGARAVVIHAGAAIDAGRRDEALAHTRELLLPILDALPDGAPDVLIEPTAGGGSPLAATVEDLAPLFAALDHHPRVGVCLDTCHAYAAGHDLATPGGVRKTLTAMTKAVGRGRLRLIHANDSKDPLGSGRDRHASIGTGTIGAEPFAELFRHAATRGVPVVVETPGDLERHRQDINLLKALRDG